MIFKILFVLVVFNFGVLADDELILSDGDTISLDDDEIQIDLKPSHCDCKNTENCSPDCFFFCNINQIYAHKDEQCEQVILSETIIEKEKHRLSEIKPVFRRANKRSAQLANEKLPKPAGCEHCSEVSRVVNQTQPVLYEKDTCKQKYIKTHPFKKSYIVKTDTCDASHKNALRKKLQKWSQDIIANEGEDEETEQLSEKLYDDCPDGCSFYTSSVLSIDEKTCRGTIFLDVNCNHEKSTTGVFGGYVAGIYVVNIVYQKQLQCVEKI